MRSNRLLILAVLSGVLAVHTTPVSAQPKLKVPAFKPLDVKDEITDKAPKDEKHSQPAKKFTIKLSKEKTYVIDLESADFDPYLRLLDKTGLELVEDADGGGELNSRIVHAATESGEHQIVVVAFDGKVGKFSLRVREVHLKGEAQPRPLAKGVLGLNDVIDEKNVTDLGKFSRVFSVDLKAGQSYMFDTDSPDFDCQLYVFDRQSRLLGQNPTRVYHMPTMDGMHHLVVASFDSKPGKFDLKVRELNLKGEAKPPRPVGKNGVTYQGDLAQKDATEIGELSKVLTVQLKAGQTYMFDIDSKDFDAQLYLFDGKSKLVSEDNTKMIQTAVADGPHHLIVKSFDDKVGKFVVKVREFKLTGESKSREVGKDGVTITAQIGNDDATPVDKLGKLYSVELKGGQVYTIDLESKTLDSYLYLFDSKNTLIAQDDDGGDDSNSRIIFRAERDGVYHIIATTLPGQEMGEFTLKVRKKE